MAFLGLLVFILGVAALVLCIIKLIKPSAFPQVTLLNSRRNSAIGIPVSLVGTFVLVGIIAAIDSPSATTAETPQGDADSSITAERAAAPSMPGIGQTIAEDKTEMTLTKVLTRAQVGTQYFVEKASDGGVLVILEYKVRNIGDKPLSSYELPKLDLIDAAGTRYSPDIGKSSSYATEADSDAKAFSDLNPDIATHNFAVFEVSKTRFDSATWFAVTPDGKKIALK